MSKPATSTQNRTTTPTASRSGGTSKSAATGSRSSATTSGSSQNRGSSTHANPPKSGSGSSSHANPPKSSGGVSNGGSRSGSHRSSAGGGGDRVGNQSHRNPSQAHFNGGAPKRVPPRERPYLHYDRPGHFYGYDRHYFGHRVHYLPRYRRVSYWGVDYYLYNGIYYRYWLGNYYVCRPPFGVLFDLAADIQLSACRFAYYNNVYRTYSAIDSNYATIQEQNRIIAENNATIAAQQAAIAAQQAAAAAQQNAVAAAPAASATPSIDVNALKSLASYQLANKLGLVQSYAGANTQYFVNDGVFYVQEANGQYKVIVPPAGALIEALPDDYDAVTLSDGNEYYKVDDTVYRMTAVDGTPYFEVLGQMPAEMAAQYNLNK
ncbi:MAG: hypothetical protein IJV01_08300 [Bacteroidales bacterium]|nr:hypothetical protein [Bacteroidales bacterium]